MSDLCYGTTETVVNTFLTFASQIVERLRFCVIGKQQISSHVLMSSNVTFTFLLKRNHPCVCCR